jgi:hypothetical protein
MQWRRIQFGGLQQRRNLRLGLVVEQFRTTDEPAAPFEHGLAGAVSEWTDSSGFPFQYRLLRFALLGHEADGHPLQQPGRQTREKPSGPRDAGVVEHQVAPPVTTACLPQNYVIQPMSSARRAPARPGSA